MNNLIAEQALIVGQANADQWPAQWLEQAQGLCPMPGDAARLLHHWRTDRDLLAIAKASAAVRAAGPFFDQSAARFDAVLATAATA